jgi:hypothetical protein
MSDRFVGDRRGRATVLINKPLRYLSAPVRAGSTGMFTSEPESSDKPPVFSQGGKGGARRRGIGVELEIVRNAPLGRIVHGVGPI